jgi:pyruvate/2-oxoglutarate dehydrogenase complex dihydrolipoamide dehydrogenase (E3) component
VLKAEDKDVVDVLVDVLSKEGVEFYTSTNVTNVEGTSGEAVTLSLEHNTLNGTLQSSIQGSHILLATGRTPNTADIGLEHAGITLTLNGFVSVDDNLCTTADGVFAVGDCAGSPHFTHVAYDDFRLVYSALTGIIHPGGKSTRQIPSVLFTSPELAHVGLREQEAEAQGTKYRVAKLQMAGFLRSRTLGETDGFAKALIAASDDRILGFTALGPGAGELLPVIQLAMKVGLPYQEIRDLVVTHPTLSEGLVFLFSGVPEAVSHE